MTVSSLEPVFSSWDSEDDLRLSQDSQQLCWIKHDTSERYWTIPNYNKIWQVWDKFAHCWRVPTTFSCQTRSVLWILPGITVSLWCSKMTFTLSWCTISAVSLMIRKESTLLNDQFCFFSQNNPAKSCKHEHDEFVWICSTGQSQVRIP